MEDFGMIHPAESSCTVWQPTHLSQCVDSLGYDIVSGCFWDLWIFLGARDSILQPMLLKRPGDHHWVVFPGVSWLWYELWKHGGRRTRFGCIESMVFVPVLERSFLNTGGDNGFFRYYLKM